MRVHINGKPLVESGIREMTEFHMSSNGLCVSVNAVPIFLMSKDDWIEIATDKINIVGQFIEAHGDSDSAMIILDLNYIAWRK